MWKLRPETRRGTIREREKDQMGEDRKREGQDRVKGRGDTLKA